MCGDLSILGNLRQIKRRSNERDMSNIDRRVQRLENGFAAEGDLDRARRAAFERSEISEQDYPAVRAQYVARGQCPPVLLKCTDGGRYLVDTGVTRSPDDPPETDPPDTTQPAFTPDNVHSRE
jgi:hypothetical protein